MTDRIALGMAGTLNDAEEEFAFLSHECQDADIVDVNAICFDVTTSCGDVYTQFASRWASKRRKQQVPPKTIDY